ncbi:hypothetical protein BDB01DRAFT_811763 [Pilobolus umbonatus]|nr:hypothetical protein BDB01DRAFT_811763 [Pilobolus umbonatus]
MLAGKKKEGVFVLPRDDCKVDPEEEHPEKAALRVLLEEAGVSADYLTRLIGSFDDTSKKGRVTAQHWMYEVHAPALLDTWSNADRERVWVTYEEALTATEKKKMSHLALEKCSLAA